MMRIFIVDPPAARTHRLYKSHCRWASMWPLGEGSRAEPMAAAGVCRHLMRQEVDALASPTSAHVAYVGSDSPVSTGLAGATVSTGLAGAGVSTNGIGAAAFFLVATAL